jgi:hypothetical protein
MQGVGSPGASINLCNIIQYNISKHGNTVGADKSLPRPTSLSNVFSAQVTGGSPTGPDPENRVGDQDIRSPGRPFSSELQVSGEPFPFWSG